MSAYKLPSDPGMLYSVVNMKLRDEYSSLDDLCLSLGVDRDNLVRRLSDAGFEYDPAVNQFR